MNSRRALVHPYEASTGRVVVVAKVLALGLIPLNIAIAAVSSWGAVVMGTPATHNLDLPDQPVARYCLMGLAGIASVAVVALSCSLFYRPVSPVSTDARQNWEPWEPIIRRDALPPATKRKPVIAFALLALVVAGAAAVAYGTVVR